MFKLCVYELFVLRFLRIAKTTRINVVLVCQCDKLIVAWAMHWDWQAKNPVALKFVLDFASCTVAVEVIEFLLKKVQKTMKNVIQQNCWSEVSVAATRHVHHHLSCPTNCHRLFAVHLYVRQKLSALSLSLSHSHFHSRLNKYSWNFSFISFHKMHNATCRLARCNTDDDTEIKPRQRKNRCQLWLRDFRHLLVGLI